MAHQLNARRHDGVGAGVVGSSKRGADEILAQIPDDLERARRTLLRGFALLFLDRRAQAGVDLGNIVHHQADQRQVAQLRHGMIGDG